MSGNLCRSQKKHLLRSTENESSFCRHFEYDEFINAKSYKFEPKGNVRE